MPDDAGAGSTGAGSTATGDSYDVVVIGAGPAGLSAALNLVRARRRTLVLDSSRPRNAATLMSHGFVTRDGISPLELRKLGQVVVEGYDEGEFQLAVVQSAEPAEGGFTIRAKGVRRAPDREVHARRILIATGLVETLPDLPSIRAYYGTAVHSCMECDGYEKRAEPLFLIGETDDLVERALLLSQWSRDIIVFTNGVAEIDEAGERGLASLGIRVDRRPVADIEGERAVVTGIRMQDGSVVPRSGGFVRPRYSTALDFLSGLDLDTDDDGHIAVDAEGRTSHAGVYAAGDSSQPGPQQLIIAAGFGARAASAINRDLLPRI